MRSSIQRVQPGLEPFPDVTPPNRPSVARGASADYGKTRRLAPAPRHRNAARQTALCVALATLALFAPITQSLAAGGREVAIEGRFTFSGRNLSKVPIGENAKAAATEAFVVQEINPDSGFSNLGGYCVALSRDTKDGFIEYANCVFRDSDGDAFYETDYTTDIGDGPKSHSKATITGGTGKFAGVSGEGESDSQFYASSIENVYQGGGYYKATLRWPAP